MATHCTGQLLRRLADVTSAFILSVPELKLVKIMYVLQEQAQEQQGLQETVPEEEGQRALEAAAQLLEDVQVEEKLHRRGQRQQTAAAKAEAAAEAAQVANTLKTHQLNTVQRLSLLAAAVQEGDAAHVEHLLSDISRTDLCTLEAPLLCQAAKDGKLDVAAALLRHSPMLAFTQQDSGDRALHCAVLCHDRSAVKLLIRLLLGADANQAPTAQQPQPALQQQQQQQQQQLTAA
jgi:hypothetical protein